MKNILIIIFILFINFISCQEIEYNFKNNDNLLTYKLLINKKNESSDWIMFINAKKDTIKNYDIKNIFFRKKNVFYSNEKTIKNRILVSDTINLVWKKNNEKKIINGYKCNTATTEFKGRRYIAYYAKKIKLDYGPWKFFGLGRLILQVESIDKEYEFKITKIDFNSKNKIPSSLELTKKNIFNSWSEYELKYKSDINEFIKKEKCNCPTDGKNILKISKIEKIYPKLHDEGIIY